MKVSVGHFEPKQEYLDKVNKCLALGYLSYGPYSEEFEHRFAARHNTRFAVLCGSGTDALRIALQAAKIASDGEWSSTSEVIIPASTFVATANIVLQTGMYVTPVDIDDTWNINPALIADAMNEQTFAVLPVHLFGQPAEMQDISETAGKDSRVAVIEDACEAMSGDHRGSPVGSWGDMGCFSMYVAHHITSGAGGVITTSDPTLYRICRSLANHGRSPDYYRIDHARATANDPEKRFLFEHIGFSSRVPEPMVALALAQLDDLDEMLAQRSIVSHGLLRGLKDLEQAGYLRFQKANPSRAWHARMLFPMMVLRSNRKEFMVYLEERGIETRTAMPLITQPCYEREFWYAGEYTEWTHDRVSRARESYPKAYELATKGLYIGCHQGLGDAEVSYVLETIHNYFKGK